MRHGPSETSPLLSPRCGEVIDLSPGNSRGGQWVSHETVNLILMLLLLCISFGDQISESPQVRIFESVICYKHYESVDPSKILISREAVGPGAIGGVAELHCKVNAVQEQLAELRGYQQFFDGIPSLALAVPFGWVADRYGRKPLFFLGLLSFAFKMGWMQLVTWFWQAFDVRLSWLSTFHALLAGGSPSSLRAAAFLRAGAVNVSATLLMPPLAAWLMRYTPWIPSIIGTILMALPIIAYPLIPETLGFRHTALSPPDTQPPTPCGESAPAPPDLSTNPPPINADFAAPITTKVIEATSLLTQDWRVPALILTFISHLIIMSASAFIMQYVSKRYSLTFANATLLMTIFSGVKVLLLSAILPWLSKAVMQCLHLSSQQKDLYLARASLLLTALGTTMIGLAPNVPTVAISMAITSLGLGAHIMIRSFLTSLVPAHHIARVFSIVSIVDTLGSMFGGALLAGLFKRGMQLGGVWIGMPFFFIGMLSAAFAVLLFIVRIRPEEGKLVQEDDDEDDNDI
ncbi:hypothetical protein BAUCODRAFT_123567 [Baudoinia panamericana UAMH 10762]|uniref:Major facilitator superfamily (MFS) profile domain-containing protein n=1 Tax=Baudoinia panamericana (strain UAMH 10762) TaxID=717646 RepID=M2LLE1_BAUPA|nr:uncharacterized protein BAUCODRAFT_123567 [Baudoinia panamericana UAMH 10762]EMC95092.1 hypothetical protein BAUCODRAFT_123567 [Baudoinia panamericana UAMH 10762]